MNKDIIQCTYATNINYDISSERSARLLQLYCFQCIPTLGDQGGPLLLGGGHNEQFLLFFQQTLNITQQFEHHITLQS